MPKLKLNRNNKLSYSGLTVPALLCGLILVLLVSFFPLRGFSEEEMLFARVPGPTEREKPAAPEKTLAPGKFLVASPRLKEAIFRETVILLIHYNVQGAVGVIINRPIEVKLSSIFTNSPALQDRGGERFYFGGPVEGNMVSFLIRSKTPPPQGLLLFGDLYSTMDKAAIELFGKEGIVIRAYAGYAGWGAGQLDREVIQGDWYIVPADYESIFNIDSEKVWGRLSGH